MAASPKDTPWETLLKGMGGMGSKEVMLFIVE